MGGADTLLYLLHPVPTPSNLPTRGSTIPSVSIHLADHHLTQLPAQSTGSSATGQHHLGFVSSAVLHILALRWISSTWTGLGGISAKPSPEKVRVCLSSTCLPSRPIPWSDNAFPGAGHFNRLGSPPLKLPSGKVVALKKLHRLEAEEPAFDNSFKNEAQMLTNIQHRNIVKLYKFCLHNRCMFLVYEYMERGSLFCALRIDTEDVELGWTQRVKVVKAIAHALSYLHHDCNPPIIHRDISSNNILLNSKLEAFVSTLALQDCYI
ncbi:hypothetical protein ACSBR2_010412 [Camellia fascicularis]